MRKLILILIVLVALIGAAVVYLVVTTPTSAHALQFPLSPWHRRLLAHVPASAEAFALVPSAALLQGKLLANPVTRDPVAQWANEHEMPRSWMLGDADVAIWKSGRTTSYAVRLDRFRAMFVRAWLLISSNADARWEGSTLIMHAAAPGAPSSDLDEMLRLAAGLPESDVFVVQRKGGRGAYPPSGRPAVTSVRVTASEILLVSRALQSRLAASRGEGQGEGGEFRSPPSGERGPTAIRPMFPRGAMLSAVFATPPRVLGDLNRLLGARIDALVDEGGAVALYDVDGGTFLPRPKGVLVIPADDHAREQLEDAQTVIALVGETREVGGNILVSFDRSSMGLYIKDVMEPGRWPATRWALRLDPKRLIPILRKVGDSPGLRFASPRLHRAARDLRRWMDALQNADKVEAALTVVPRSSSRSSESLGGESGLSTTRNPEALRGTEEPVIEELRVRVSSK